MGNKQSADVTNLTKVKSLYKKGLTHETADREENALSDYTRALAKIEAIQDEAEDIIELRYQILLHISDIYVRQHELTLAKEFIEKASGIATENWFVWQSPDKITEFSDRLSQIKRLQGSSAFDDISKSATVESSQNEVETLNICKSNDGIGEIHSKEGNYDYAVLIYQKSLETALTVVTNDHPYIAQSYSNIGSIYAKQGKYSDAHSMYRKALNILIIVYGKEHVDVAVIYDSIGSLYDDQDKYDSALPFYQKAASILATIFDENHSDIVKISDKIENCYGRLYRHDIALIAGTVPPSRLRDLYRRLQRIGLSIRRLTRLSNRPQLVYRYTVLGDILQVDAGASTATQCVGMYIWLKFHLTLKRLLLFLLMIRYTVNHVDFILDIHKVITSTGMQIRSNSISF